MPMQAQRGGRGGKPRAGPCSGGDRKLRAVRRQSMLAVQLLGWGCRNMNNAGHGRRSCRGPC